MPERIIKEMPDQITLEEFLKGMNGESEPKVIFDTDKHEFVWKVPKPKPEPKLGSAKTEFGRELRRL